MLLNLLSLAIGKLPDVLVSPASLASADSPGRTVFLEEVVVEEPPTVKRARLLAAQGLSAVQQRTSVPNLRLVAR